MLMTIIILGITCIILSYLYFGQTSKLLNLQDQIEREKLENMQLKIHIFALKNAINKAGMHDNNPNISSELADAVKYAMVHSHPDNGGKQEDFIKFRKLYQQLKVK